MLTILVHISGCCILRFDRFTEAFEHVSGVIDDIYKVHFPIAPVSRLYIVILLIYFLRNFLIMQVLRPFWVLTMEK